MTSSEFDTANVPPAIGQLVSTHWHVTKRIFSVKMSGRPVYYVPALHLVDCKFVIDKRLRAMFEARPSRRTVHALIKGKLVGYDAKPIGGELVRCHPFEAANFFRESDKRVVVEADEIVLHPDRRIEARGLRFG
jgi:hypothetical protein